MTILQQSRALLLEAVKRSGEDIQSCYQCQKCTLGCPMAFAMDYRPHQIIRLLQYGMQEKIWASETLWICASCEACGVRCPNGINIAALMDALRQMAREKGVRTKNMDIPVFHEIFLASVRRRGRIHEVFMLAHYKLKTLNLFADLMLGWDLFRRGKLPLKGHVVKDKEEMKKIFSRSTL